MDSWISGLTTNSAKKDDDNACGEYVVGRGRGVLYFRACGECVVVEAEVWWLIPLIMSLLIGLICPATGALLITQRLFQ